MSGGSKSFIPLCAEPLGCGVSGIEGSARSPFRAEMKSEPSIETHFPGGKKPNI